MLKPNSISPALLSVVLAACDPGSGNPVTPDVGEQDFYQLAEPAQVAALTSAPAPLSEACHAVGGLVRPTGVAHLHDPALAQQVGPLLAVSLDPGDPFPGLWFRRGSILATITEATPTGEALVNHHLVFSNGVIRTEDDPIQLTPTDDPCVFSLAAELNIVDGTGAYEGVTGFGEAFGDSNVCTGQAQLVWAAQLCP